MPNGEWASCGGAASTGGLASTGALAAGRPVAVLAGWVNAGDSAAVAANVSSAAVTSRCTRAWVPPASGTWAGLPVFRTAARTSANTQQTSCSQASQTATDSSRTMLNTSSWWVSTDKLGSECGTGRPNTVTRASGTPAVSASRAAVASSPMSRSVGERRAGRRVPGIGAAISRVLPD